MKPRWTAIMIHSDLKNHGIKLYDDTFRIIYDENLVYLYLNFKLLLHRFHISSTHSPDIIFDMNFLKSSILNYLNQSNSNLNNSSNEKFHKIISLKSPTLRFSYDSSLNN